MSLDVFKQCLWSLREFPGRVGLMGGEPTVHPKFKQLCEIIQREPVLDVHKKKGRDRYSLFTSGGKLYEKHKPLIDATFQYVALNEHTEAQRAVCKHQPNTLAIGDMVENKELRDKLIWDCWAQKTWCPTITPKGGFFCELAAGIDRIFDMEGGYPIEKDWWRKTPEQYWDQVERYCPLCGMPVPIERETMDAGGERVSSGLLKKMKEHGLINLDRVREVKEPLSEEYMQEVAKTWNPGHFRQDLWGECGC